MLPKVTNTQSLCHLPCTNQSVKYNPLPQRWVQELCSSVNRCRRHSVLPWPTAWHCWRKTPSINKHLETQEISSSQKNDAGLYLAAWTYSSTTLQFIWYLDISTSHIFPLLIRYTVGLCRLKLSINQSIKSSFIWEKTPSDTDAGGVYKRIKK